MKKIMIILGIVIMVFVGVFANIITNPVIQTDKTHASYTNITQGTITLIDLLDGKQKYLIQYNTSVITATPTIDEFYSEGTGTDIEVGVNTDGTDNLVVLGCAINSTIDGTQIIANSYDGDGCSFQFEIVQSHLDNKVSYGLAFNDGSYEFIDDVTTILFAPLDLYYVDNSKTNNFSQQHFKRTYAINNKLNINLTDIQWSINAKNDIDTLSIVIGAQNLNKSIENDIIAEDVHYTIDYDTFTYDKSYDVSRQFNVTNPYPMALGEMQIRVPLTNYVGNASLLKWNGTMFNSFGYGLENITMVSVISSLDVDQSDLYKIGYDANVIDRSMPKSTFQVVGGSGYYERYYKFNPIAQYLTPFTGQGTITIIDNVTREDNMDNWNNRLRYNITTTYNENPLAINYDAQDHYLLYNFTVNNAVIPTYMQVEYWVTETIESSTGTGTGGTGGGGGGGSIIIEIPADDGKSDCAITITPSTIRLNDANVVQQIIITNDENEILNPNFGFKHIDGDKFLTDALKLINNPQSVQAKSSVSFGVSVNKFAGKGKADAQMVITTAQCKNVIVPIQIEITQETLLAVLFQTPLNELAKEMYNLQAFKSVNADEESMMGIIINKINTVGGLATIVAILLAFALLPLGNNTEFASSKVADGLIRLFLWVLGTGLTLIILQSVFG